LKVDCRNVSIRALVVLLIVFSVSSLALVDSAKALTQIDVTVDSGKIIDTNDFALGFSLDHVMNSDERDFLYASTVRQLAANASFKLVRFVDFRSGFTPCTRWYESSKTGSFDWTGVDDLVKKISAIGAEPLVVLGCFTGYGTKPILPSGMAVNPSTGLPYAESFAAYCAEWVRHFKSKGMQVRFYEIMNEAWYYFWNSWGNTNIARRNSLVTLLNTVFDRMHGIDSRVLLGTDSSLFRSFLDYYAIYGRGLGFFSFHKYDSGSTLDSFVTDSYRYSPDQARQVWSKAHAGYLPAILSETNLSWIYQSGTDPRTQKMAGAIWTALMIKACIAYGVQYSVYYRLLSSKQAESRKSTGGYGFGMVNSDNDQPWYPYYAQKMIGNNLRIGDRIVSSSSSGSQISTLAWIDGSKLNLLLICKTSSQVSIHLNGVSGQLNYLKIDNTISWLSPKMQSGMMTSTSGLTLNGYTVMLLQRTV